MVERHYLWCVTSASLRSGFLYPCRLSLLREAQKPIMKCLVRVLLVAQTAQFNPSRRRIFPRRLLPNPNLSQFLVLSLDVVNVDVSQGAKRIRVDVDWQVNGPVAEVLVPNSPVICLLDLAFFDFQPLRFPDLCQIENKT